MRPWSLCDVVERARRDGDWDRHLREFLDAFYGDDGDLAVQASRIGAPAGFIGLPEADAFIGGAGEHLARRWGLPIPAWVRCKARYLDHAMFVPNEKPLWGYLLCASPVSFRVRLIFTGPEPLQRARFPYHRGVLDLPLTYPAPATEPAKADLASLAQSAT